MRFTEIVINNFKALRDVTVPLSRFVCVIGENNAGKSSLMMALLRFIDGAKLDKSFYFDPGQQITIQVRMADIGDEDLALIANSEHRSRFAAILKRNAVTLVRRYALDGTSSLRWIARVPVDTRFDEEAISKLLEGKRPGSQFASDLVAVFPELQGKVDAKTNQTRARELIHATADAVSDDEKKDQERDLPSGIDNSVRPFLPDPIYIPGVKDLADDIKTKDSANFGRLLGIVLDAITPELAEAEEAFSFLKKSLNRTVNDAGQVKDDRLSAVKEIEATVEKYVQNNFPAVRLDIRIPPPEIKTILSSAEVWANDGVPGPMTSKGDGLKRAVTFAILRTYVELKRRESNKETKAASSSYIFLFEEPELFLYPVAQRMLFDALGEIAATNHVIVTTHSPMFFQPSAASTFVKMQKRTNPAVAAKPFSEALSIDIRDLDNKAQFQLITYETTNTAFFSKGVVLVEGDSDYLVLPHLAKTINPEWNADRVGLAFCRVSGKGNVARYRSFFRAFDIQVCVIADLDCIIDGFEHLDASEASKTVRERLIQQIDTYIQNNAVAGSLSSREYREISNSPQRREQYGTIRRIIEKCGQGTATPEEVEELVAAGNAFFGDEANKKRRTVLQTSNVPEIQAGKRELLRLLRDEGICLLEKGEIEEYYPDAVTGPDKPSKALRFCEVVDTKEKALALCNAVPVPLGQPCSEFELIFARVFRSANPSPSA